MRVRSLLACFFFFFFASPLPPHLFALRLQKVCKRRSGSSSAAPSPLLAGAPRFASPRSSASVPAAASSQTELRRSAGQVRCGAANFGGRGREASRTADWLFSVRPAPGVAGGFDPAPIGRRACRLDGVPAQPRPPHPPTRWAGPGGLRSHDPLNPPGGVDAFFPHLAGRDPFQRDGFGQRSQVNFG